MTGEQREQVAAQLEAVAKRIRAGEDVGGLSASWVCSGFEGDWQEAMSAEEARAEAAEEIGAAKDDWSGEWREDTHRAAWGLVVWVERAQACDIQPNICVECEGKKTNPDGSECEDCDGSGRGHGDCDYVCDYGLAPIPPNAVLYQHREGPDTIEADGGES